MSWINKAWGENKENQFKGFILVFLSTIFGLSIILLFSLRFFGMGEELPLSPLFYLAFLVIISANLALKAWFKSSLIIICFLFFELFFSYGGFALAKIGVGGVDSFMPDKKNSQFSFHPTLGVIPNPAFGNQKIAHTSGGLRSTSKAFDSSLPHIAIFGGSTTYDIGVTSNENTWVSLLGELLPKSSVSNNGVPGYSTVEHVIQTSFYSDRAGAMPACSIYYIGWNDIRSYGFTELDPGYARFHMPSQYGNMRVRYMLNSFSPTLNIITAFLLRRELPFPTANGQLGKDVTHNDELFAIVDNNLRVISAINSSRGINTIFIPQMLNRAELVDDTQANGWLPFVYDADVWPLQERFNIFLESLANTLGDEFIDPNINTFNPSDFVDKGHFNNVGAEKMARNIAPYVRSVCS
ncbi:hypothetical protein OAP28_03580 [Planktomarina sp.]|nr:hypothetical protein [Planktomarina sp.]